MPNSNHNSLPVMLSASVPNEVVGTPEAQRVYDFVTAVIDALLDAGMHLIFGGHPTITPLVHQAVLAGLTQGKAKPPITLFQLERFRGKIPSEAEDKAVFDDLRWVGDPKLEIEADLPNLRQPMVELARAAVFIGGKTTGFRGGKPGIRDELERFRKRHPDAPAYLVGGAGGEAARLIAEEPDLDHEKLGLAGEARRMLHTSRDEHLVAALIARDLTRGTASSRPH